MDYLRHHLSEEVARRRPELLTADFNVLVDQIIEFVERYNPNTEPAGGIGFVITCQPDGKITEVIQEGLGLGSRLAPDTDFRAIMSPFHKRKAARFLRSVQANHASYDCPLSVLGRSGLVRLSCSGFSVGPHIVVIATENPLAVAVPQELFRLAEKKPARLGPALKELAAWRKVKKSAPPAAADDRLHASEAEALSQIEVEHSGAAGRRRLLEVAAHDLRNPVSGILAACQYLIGDASQALAPHQVLILCSIESSALLALQLIEAMGEIPSVRLDKPELELRPTDLNAVIRQAVSTVRPLADSTNVKIFVRVRDKIPAIKVDGIRLGEALHGLLVNIMGSPPAAGEIEIVVAIRAAKAIMLFHRDYATAAGLKAPTAVAHPGTRRSPRKLSDIYAALLLARTRRIVEAHGGQMRFEPNGKHEYSWAITLPVGHASHARARHGLT